MEYTKDIILNVNYVQAGEKKDGKNSILYRMLNKIAKHKMISTIISMTLILMILDIVLISSFVNVLSSI